MPCAIEIVKEMFEKQKAKELAKIPMSNDSVKRRIAFMSEDIVSQCIDRLRVMILLYNSMNPQTRMMIRNFLQQVQP
ncbi:UNVERIFIED_CONTAM: hypothetical protein FKN15_072900 [Acipenser sinensis]